MEYIEIKISPARAVKAKEYYRDVAFVKVEGDKFMVKLLCKDVKAMREYAEKLLEKV